MIPLIWVLTWLPRVLPAMSELPQPVNLALNSAHFRTMLKWEPGPGTPTGVYYQVTFTTDRGTSLVPVPGCEHVKHPLVCNLTNTFSDPNKSYLAQVTTLLGAAKSQPASYSDFKLIRDSQLDLPLLTVTPCDMNLCVDLQFPKFYMSQLHRDIYNSSLTYKFKINGADIDQEIKYLQKHIVKPVVPGKLYCVSVCLWDRLESKESNYSQPVCASTPDIFSADPWISAGLCVLVMFVVGVVAFLFSAGFLYPWKRPLPLVLTSVPHIEESLVIAGSCISLSSVLTLKATLPSSDEMGYKKSSDESDMESETESTGGDYQMRVGANLLSSSFSTSSSVSPPLCPEPEPQPLLSSNQISNSAETCFSCAVTHTLSTHTDSRIVGTTEPDEEEKEMVGEGGSQDVNLLTLTFGRHEMEEEEEQESHLDVAEVEPEISSVSEECNITLVQPPQSRDTREAAIETVSCSADEEDKEEEEEVSEYRGRPCTAVLKKLL